MNVDSVNTDIAKHGAYLERIVPAFLHGGASVCHHDGGPFAITSRFLRQMVIANLSIWLRTNHAVLNPEQSSRCNEYQTRNTSQHPDRAHVLPSVPPLVR